MLKCNDVKANSIEPDQSIQSGFTLFARDYLSKYLRQFSWAFTVPHIHEPFSRQSRLLSSAPLICLYSWVADIVNNIDPDQTAPKGAV